MDNGLQLNSEQPYNQFRIYHNRNLNSGGSSSPMADALGSIAQAISAWGGAMQQRKQNDVANQMMDSGDVNGAPAYVRRAEYPDGDQGEDPGPTPFPSQDTPHTGGTAEMKMRQQNAMDAVRNADMQERVRSMKAGGPGRAPSAREAWALQNGRNPYTGRPVGDDGMDLPTSKPPDFKPDSYEDFEKTVRSAIGKDSGLTPAQLAVARWTYPTKDPNTTALVMPDPDNRVKNPAFVPATPDTSFLGMGNKGGPGTPPEIPAEIPADSTVTVPTQLALNLLARKNALDKGTPLRFVKGTDAPMTAEEYQNRFSAADARSNPMTLFARPAGRGRSNVLPQPAGGAPYGNQPADEPPLPTADDESRGEVGSAVSTRGGPDAKPQGTSPVEPTGAAAGASKPSAVPFTSAAPAPTPADQAALAFVQKNPSDPRAAAMMAVLKQKGLLK